MARGRGEVEAATAKLPLVSTATAAAERAWAAWAVAARAVERAWVAKVAMAAAMVAMAVGLRS